MLVYSHGPFVASVNVDKLHFYEVQYVYLFNNVFFFF